MAMPYAKEDEAQRALSVVCSLPDATDMMRLHFVRRIAASATRLVLTELHPMEETGLQLPPGLVRIFCQVVQQLRECR
jgi:hypothetical protein